jgi:hypothetical protein
MTALIKEHFCIKFCFKLEKNATEILRTLKELFFAQENAVDLHSVGRVL